jgi:pilus assembly protein CpaB
MKPRTLILMGVAVVCGLVASYLTSRMLAQQTPAPETAKVQVLVAKAKIPYGTQLKEPEKYFTLKEFPSGTEPKLAMRTFEEVKDRRVKKTISAEVFITPDDLMSKTDEALAGIITVGTRAYTIPVKTDTSGGGYVLPLMRVDVLGTVRTDKGPMAATILQNVLVLGVDQKSNREDQNQTMVASTVTLQVKPDEALKLTAALSVGELRLTLRGMGDNDVVKTEPVRPIDVIKDTTKGDEPAEGDGTDDGQGTGGTAVSKVPNVPEAAPTPPVAPPPPPEPTTITHVITFINGQSVNRHPVTLDKKTLRPTGTDVEKETPRPTPEKETPKPAPEKVEETGEKTEPRSDKPEVEKKESLGEK